MDSDGEIVNLVIAIMVCIAKKEPALMVNYRVLLMQIWLVQQLAVLMIIATMTLGLLRHVRINKTNMERPLCAILISIWTQLK
jgi:hypothetical protein